MNKMGRIGRGTKDRGAVMVELALILPILVMLLIGIIDFGRAFNAQVSIQGAAREGARSLALGQSSAEVATAVNGAAGAVVPSGIAQTRCPTTVLATSQATVTVSSTFDFNIPFVSLGRRTLSATARMRCGL